MNITDIISEYGAYYESGDATRIQRLKTQLFVPEHFGKLFAIQPTKETYFKSAVASIGQVAQEFQKAYTPLSNATVIPQMIELEKIKIDLEEEPHALEASWLGFLTRLGMENGQTMNQNILEWPFIRWYLEMLVIPKHNEQMEMSEYFWGKRGAVTPNVATVEGKTINGINAKIEADKLKSTPLMNYITGTAYPTDPKLFVQFLEGVVDQFLTDYPALARFKFEILLSSSLHKRYKRGFRELYGKDTDQLTLSANISTIIDNQLISLIGCTAMDNDPANPNTSSDKMILTYAENRIRPIIFPQNSQSFMVVPSGANPRTAWMYTDWWEAIDFARHEHVTIIEP